MELIKYNTYIDYNYLGGRTFQQIGKHIYTDRDFVFCVAVTVLEGKYFVKVQHQVIELLPGETVFVPSHIKHDVWMEEEGLISYVHFTCCFMWLDIFGLLRQGCFVTKDKKIRELINEINRSHYESELLEKICKDRIIADIILSVFGEKKLDESNLCPEEWFYQTLSYINSHIHEPVSVERLIELTRYSKTAFYKKFRQNTGMTPQEYIIYEKMNYAAVQLMNGKKVKEAAKSIGFYDEDYFGKVFKKVFGVAPSRYKMQNKLYLK